jgi:hypothetical protein
MAITSNCADLEYLYIRIHINMELLFILIVLALFLLAFALLIVFYQWLLKRGFRRLALFFPTMIIVVVGYGAYVSLVPRDGFYRRVGISPLYTG